MKKIHLAPQQAWTFARLPDLLLHYQAPTDLVVHVGAHHGEEVSIYRDCGFTRIRLIEPDPAQIDYLNAAYAGAPDIEIIAAAVVPAGTGPVTLHRRERTVHSSLFPGSGESVEVASLLMPDIQPGANLLVIDVQGLELELLKTADLTDPALCMVIVETTHRRDDSAANFDDVAAYMRERSWAGAEEWVHDLSGYTDSVYVPGGR